MARSLDQIIERQLHRWDRVAATLGYDPSTVSDESRPALTQAQAAHQPVITISRDLGVHEGEITRGLAAALNYEVFGKDIIDHISRDVNVQRRLIGERDEHFRSGFALLVEGTLAGHHVDNREYIEALGRVLRSIARRGGVIILGRGAHLILRSEAALHIRLTAPAESRVRYLCEADGISDREALAKIQKSDHERHGFIRHYFHADLNDPTSFDVVINTGRVSPEGCVQVIRAALAARGVEIRHHADS